MNPRSGARHKVWRCIKHKGITSPLTIARKENLKLSIVKQVMRDIEAEGLLDIVQEEYKIKV